MKKKVEKIILMLCILFSLISIMNYNTIKNNAYSVDTTTNEVVYSKKSDFVNENSDLKNVIYSNKDSALVLSVDEFTNDCIWVPNSKENTVSKVDCVTGNELGRYYTGPTAINSDPSRTTVDKKGNCWVTNRKAGNVVKIAADHYIDRNKNGKRDTSTDTNGNGIIDASEILPWGSDECVVLQIDLQKDNEHKVLTFNNSTAYSTESSRSVAIDEKNNIWAGNLTSSMYYNINGETGKIINKVNVFNNKPYGAFYDQNGFLWSVSKDNSHLLKMDSMTLAQNYIPLNYKPYGIAIDKNNNKMYTTSASEPFLSIIDTITNNVTYKGVSSVGKGIAVTSDGDIWYCASRLPSGGTGGVDDGIVRVDGDNLSEKKFFPSEASFSNPKGISISKEKDGNDTKEKVWVVCDDDNGSLVKIDVESEKIDFVKSIGSHHYSYSDMTGSVSRSEIKKKGDWETIYDSQISGTTWQAITWTAVTPIGTTLKIEASTCSVRSTKKSDWSSPIAITNGGVLNSLVLPPNQFIKIKAEFETTNEESPLFKELRILGNTLPPITPTDNNPPWAESMTLKVKMNIETGWKPVICGDPDNDTLTLKLVSSTLPGTIDTNSTSFNYTPPLGWSGTGSFDYCVVDSKGNKSDNNTVTIIINTPPIIYGQSITTNGVEKKISFNSSLFCKKYFDINRDAMNSIKITSIPTNGELIGKVILNKGDEDKETTVEKIIENGDEIMTGDLDSMRFDGGNFDEDAYLPETFETSFKWQASDGEYFSNEETFYIKIKKQIIDAD